MKPTKSMILIGIIVVIAIGYFLRLGSTGLPFHKNDKKAVEERAEALIKEELPEKTTITKDMIPQDLQKKVQIKDGYIERVMPDGIRAGYYNPRRGKVEGEITYYTLHLDLVADVKDTINETYLQMMKDTQTIIERLASFKLKDKLTSDLSKDYIRNVKITWKAPVKNETVFEPLKWNNIANVNFKITRAVDWPQSPKHLNDYIDMPIELNSGFLLTKKQKNAAFKVGDTAVVDQVAFTLNEVKKVSDSIIQVNYTIKNNSKYKLLFDSSSNLRLYAESNKDERLYGASNNQQQEGFIAPGDQIKITTNFEAGTGTKYALQLGSLSYMETDDKNNKFLKLLQAGWVFDVK